MTLNSRTMSNRRQSPMQSTSAGPGSSSSPSSHPLGRLAAATANSGAHFSPLTTFGSPVTHSDRSTLAPWSALVGNGSRQQACKRRKVSNEGGGSANASSSNDSSSVGDGGGIASGSSAAFPAIAAAITKPRAKGRDVYGGRVMYGGGNSSSVAAALSGGTPSATTSSTPFSLGLTLLNSAPSTPGARGATAEGASSYLRRTNRLLASMPYHSQARQAQRQVRRQRIADAGGNVTAPASEHNQPELRRMSTSSTSSASATMSTTAKLILDTLEKMSTPVRDAQKIPVAAPSARAERRRQIAEELLEGTAAAAGSLLTGSPHKSAAAAAAGRRRPRLGGGNGGVRSLPGTPAASAATTSSNFLNGPPLRSQLFAPLAPNSPKRQSSEAARLSRLEPRPSPSAAASSASKASSTAAPAKTVFPSNFFSNAFAPAPSSATPPPPSSSGANKQTTSSSSVSKPPSSSSSPPKPVVPSFLSSQQQQPSSSSASAPTMVSLLQQQPQQQQQGGKVRTKVGDRAKARAERNLGAAGGDDDGPEVPAYLAASSNNPFAGVTTLPTFAFSSPKKIDGAKDKSATNLTPARDSRLRLEEGQSLLTSPDLNPADSPMQPAAAAAAASKRRMRMVPEFPDPAADEDPDPTSVMQRVFRAAGKSAESKPAAAAAAATSEDATAHHLTNGINGDEASTTTTTKTDSFRFSEPEQLKAKLQQLLSPSSPASDSCYSYDFSSPLEVTK